MPPEKEENKEKTEEQKPLTNREKMSIRRAALQDEFNKGNALMDQCRNTLRENEPVMLRISGAIQILDELLADEDKGKP